MSTIFNFKLSSYGQSFPQVVNRYRIVDLRLDMRGLFKI